MLLGFNGLYATLVCIACSQLQKLRANLLDIRQKQDTAEHPDPGAETGHEERQKVHAFYHMQDQLNDCVRHHQQILRCLLFLQTEQGPKMSLTTWQEIVMHWFNKLHKLVIILLFQLHSSDGGDVQSDDGGDIPARSSLLMSWLILYSYGEETKILLLSERYQFRKTSTIHTTSAIYVVSIRRVGGTTSRCLRVSWRTDYYC